MANSKQQAKKAKRQITKVATGSFWESSPAPNSHRKAPQEEEEDVHVENLGVGHRTKSQVF